MKKASDDYGLAYKALDLHVHSPASKDDYQDRDATASDIVDAAIRASLDGICITDHNTAEWVDSVARAAKGKPLAVFPGIEVSVTGGKEGPVHIVGIFDPGRTSEEINDIIAPLGLTKAKRGKTDELAEGDPNTVIDQIARHGGIAVLAHADSSHGVLHDMKGQPRIQVIQNPRLVAAEVSREKYRKVLDGTDPQYKRLLPTYEASDAHSLSEIGCKRTYFKVRSLSLESLRQCFYDPEVRVRRQDQYEECERARFPRVVRVSIEQGFFDGEEVVLHPCQNTLIGGQGVGKSLLIEFIRFALDQASTIPEIVTDAQGKLQKQLGVGGRVCIEIELSNGTCYEVRRTYDGRSNPIEVINIETGEPYKGEIARLFPIMAYSQTEAVHIAWNPQAQLELIDRFIDAQAFRRRIEEILAALRKNDQELSDVIDAKDRLAAVEKDIHTREEEIANLERSLKSSTLKDMKSADRQKDAFEAELEYHDTLASLIEELIDQLVASYQPAKLSKVLAKNERLSKSNRQSQSALDELLSDLRASLAKIKKSRRVVKKLLAEWLPDYEEVQAAYEAFIREAGGDQKSLEAKRRTLEEDKKQTEKEAKTLRTESRRFDRILKSRDALLDELDQAMIQFYEARKRKYDELTEMSEGKLLLAVSRAENREAFASALKEIATGTRIRKADLVRIAEQVSPRKFIALVLERDSDAIVEQGGVDPGTAEKLVNWLSVLEAQESVLALQHQFLPEDTPSIRFRKDDGEYHDISEISVGQKCTALLMIALSAGDAPIIIDQPEESIDIASVFSDIVSKLRSGKDYRQYILATHNPNIAVTADSDLIHVLKSSATKGQIVNRGVIEDDEVRLEVIQHLEGGKKPYLLRGRKYGLLGAEPAR